MQLPAPGILLTLGGYFGLLFAVYKFKNGGWAGPAMLALLSAGLILFATSRIVNGGETNFVLAAAGLYVSIFNLFTSLLSLFGIGSSDE